MKGGCVSVTTPERTVNRQVYPYGYTQVCEECGDKLSTPHTFYEEHEKEDERKFHPQHVREGL